MIKTLSLLASKYSFSTYGRSCDAGDTTVIIILHCFSPSSRVFIQRPPKRICSLSKNVEMPSLFNRSLSIFCQCLPVSLIVWITDENLRHMKYLIPFEFMIAHELCFLFTHYLVIFNRNKESYAHLLSPSIRASTLFLPFLFPLFTHSIEI